jgi:hypothetical protein
MKLLMPLAVAILAAVSAFPQTVDPQPAPVAPVPTATPAPSPAASPAPTPPKVAGVDMQALKQGVAENVATVLAWREIVKQESKPAAGPRAPKTPRSPGDPSPGSDEQLAIAAFAPVWPSGETTAGSLRKECQAAERVEGSKAGDGIPLVDFVMGSHCLGFVTASVEAAPGMFNQVFESSVAVRVFLDFMDANPRYGSQGAMYTLYTSLMKIGLMRHTLPAAGR